MCINPPAVGSRVSLSAAAVLVCALVVGSASGGPPGRWSALAQGSGLGASAQEVGVARTPDGVLHVAWKQDTGPLSSVIRVRSITRTGTVGPEVTAVSGYGLAGDPALLAAGGALRLFFPAGAPTEGMLSSTAPTAGSPWSAPALVTNEQLARARTPAVTLAPDGTPLQTWYGSGIVVHRGLAPGGAQTLPASGTEARPNIATDAAGHVWVVWCRFGGSGPVGTIAQRADPASGAPVGSQIQLPGSRTEFQGTQKALCVLDATVARNEPLAARAGGGVYAAGTTGYPKRTGVLVWRLDASGVARTFTVASTRKPAHLGYYDPAVAAAPDGRVWVAWVERDGRTTKIVARRSNHAGTAFGAAVQATPPGGISTAAVNLAAQADRTDLIGLVQSSSGALSIQHTQLWPGLTLVRGSSARRGRRGVVLSFRALDAGEPVGGVRVRVAGKSAVTAKNGVAKLAFRRSAKKQRATASATRSGYVGARLSFACC